MTIHVALAGAGAFGITHLDALKLSPDVKVVSLISRALGTTQDVAVVAQEAADALVFIDVRRVG